MSYFILWFCSNKTPTLVSYLKLYTQMMSKANNIKLTFDIVQIADVNTLQLNDIASKSVNKIICVSSNMLFKKQFRLEMLQVNEFIDGKIYCLDVDVQSNTTLGEYFHTFGHVCSMTDMFVYDNGFASNNDIFNKEYVFNFPIYLYRFYDQSMDPYVKQIVNNEPITEWTHMPFYVMKSLNTYFNDYHHKVVIHVNSQTRINLHSVISSNIQFVYICDTYDEYDILQRQCENKNKYCKNSKLVQVILRTGLKFAFDWYKMFTQMCPKTQVVIYENDVLKYSNYVEQITMLPISFFYTHTAGMIVPITGLEWTQRKVPFSYTKIKPFYDNINRLFYGKRVDEAFNECLILANDKCKYKTTLLKKIIGCSILMKTSTQQLTKLLNALKVDDEELIVQIATMGEMLKSGDIVTMFLGKYIAFMESNKYNPKNLLLMMSKLNLYRSLNINQVTKLWEHYMQCIQYEQSTNIEPTIKKFLDYILMSDNKELMAKVDEFMKNTLKININDFEKLQERFPLFTYHKLVKIDPYPNNKNYFDESRKQIMINLDMMIQKYNIVVSLNDIIYYTPSNFYYSYHGKSSRDIFQKQCQLLRKLCPELNYKYQFREGVNKKIRVGFVSNNLNRWHSVFKDRHQVIKHLSEHPNFEVYVFYFDDIHIDVINVYAKCHLVKCKQRIDDVRNTIIKYNLNVLVYPEIGMDKVCYFSAFMRLAKHQINTWGHSDTSGIDTIDYYISSRLFEHVTDLATNEPAQSHYSEKLVLLNSLSTCYVNPITRYSTTLEEFVKQMKPRVDFGFSNYNNIYFCLQSLFKINPVYDNYLCEILEKDVKSILILIENDKKHKLIERLEPVLKHNMSRIHWLKGCEHRTYLNYMYISDVVLDTYPFGGCNSSFEAFSLGKPVVTQPSEMINGRFTYGFYQKMEITDLICNNQKEYVSAALMIANNKVFRQRVSNKIRQNSHKLFNDQETLHEWTNFLESLK